MSQGDLPVGAPTVPQPRRLAISIDPLPGESLIGMVARATRLNVLGRTSVILHECGLRLLHPGTIGQDIQDCDRLALQLGCPISEVEGRLHSYLPDPAGPADVRWGSGALIRSDIVVEQRRVSPSSLKVSDHHRAAWMNRLLPYCPESLELLIDTCLECGNKQGWRRGWGIGICDDHKCRAALRHPTGERLPSRFADGYRIFAGMVSPDPAERETALSKLAPELVALPPAVLVNLTLQLGATVRESPFKIHRATAGKLPAVIIADIAASGAQLLMEWPRNLRTGILQELNRSQRSAPRSRKLLEAVRRLAIARPIRPEQVAVVRNAIPEAFEHVSVALASLVKPVLGANSVCRATNLSTSELRAIREAGLITHEIIAQRKRTQVQFDKAEVLELARCQRNSVFASRLEQRFGLPRYASEQLACLGAVQREAHPALALVHPTLRLVEQSIEEFTRDLEKRGRAGPGGDTILPLGTAIRVIGGRPKPWGAILQAMRNGSLPFWLQGKGKFIRRAHVLLDDILAFAKTDFDEGRYPHFPFAAAYSQIDAAGILNLDALQIQPLIHSGQLLFEPSGVALMTPRQAVLGIAKRIVSTAEVALRTGIRFNNVPRFMAGHPQIARSEAGWIRADFEKVFGRL